MRAMVFEHVGERLKLVDRPLPDPSRGDVRLRVEACAVCRTDLHVVDGELPNAKLPLVLGHEIVGIVDEVGEGVPSHLRGRRLGVPWLGWTCGACAFCRSGHENLCDEAKFTGYQIDGGYAEFCVASLDYCFELPSRWDAAKVAPLLCAGLIGHRSLRMTSDARRIGIFGFGAAAHIVAQVARAEGREVVAFTRPGDTNAQRLATKLGATWAGGSDETPPSVLDAAIIFAPVGSLVPRALELVRKGGVVVCGGIHMSDIPAFPYSVLWGERTLRSVANLCRRDGEEFFRIAESIEIDTVVTRYSLDRANEALDDLRGGVITGAGVLIP